jgi:hypothetical protein
MLARESATTAATKTLDVNLTDIISRIQIRFEPINNGSTPTAHPAKCVSKIELVDGSDVLMQMSGMEAQALDFYDTKQCREYEMDMRNDMPDQEFFNLNFGRYLWDKMLAFDPKKFNNPQLKITHNLASGGSAPDAAYLSVYADVFDEKVPSPTGWLMAKDYHTFTTEASTYKPITMPKDYVLRKLMIQALVAGSTFTDSIDELRLSENNQKKTPIDIGLYQYIAGLMKKYPMYQELIVCTYAASSANYLYVTPGEYTNMSLGVLGSATVYKNGAGGGGKETIYSSALSPDARCLVTGQMPHGCLPVEFGDPNDPDDWYDITSISNLELRLHAVAASATVNTLLQQYRKYA